MLWEPGFRLRCNCLMAKFLVLVTALAFAFPGLAAAKEPQSGRVCGSSACRPVPAQAVWRLVPWYGFALPAPQAQPFFRVDLRPGSVVWVPGADVTWTDARQGAIAAWTRPAPALRQDLRRWTRGLRPYPPAEDWRPVPRLTPVTVVKACGPRGCRGVGRAGESGRLGRAEAMRASPVAAPAGPWFRVVVRQKGRNGFVWSLRYAPGRRRVLIDRTDSAPPYWVPAPIALIQPLDFATAGLAPFAAR